MMAAPVLVEAFMNEKHGRGAVEEALRMVQLFASVGVSAFDITHTNIDQEKRVFRPKQSLEQVRRSLPHLLKSAPQRQNSIIFRPIAPPPVFLIQIDDLAAAALERVRPFAFLILETSPGNAQAWLAVKREGEGETRDFARRVRKAAGADPSASGATRVAGTTNYKRKYAPAFPVVTITGAKAGHIVTPQALQAAGLVSPPERAPALPPAAAGQGSRRVRGRWPSYEYCLSRAPTAHGEDKPDISRADFAWCMTAIDWGWSVESTAHRLMEASLKAQENGERYAMDTARNAAAAVQRRRGQSAQP